mmetsp:Transcript_362/g.1398  ORF Transcript_362/g.1398 Transcript_362/m.1398 type:complete len:268 (+) Transcript_362:235-1038(+)
MRSTWRATRTGRMRGPSPATMRTSFAASSARSMSSAAGSRKLACRWPSLSLRRKPRKPSRSETQISAPTRPSPMASSRPIPSAPEAAEEAQRRLSRPKVASTPLAERPRRRPSRRRTRASGTSATPTQASETATQALETATRDSMPSAARRRLRRPRQIRSPRRRRLPLLPQPLPLQMASARSEARLLARPRNPRKAGTSLLEWSRLRLPRRSKAGCPRPAFWRRCRRFRWAVPRPWRRSPWMSSLCSARWSVKTRPPATPQNERLR